METFHLFFHFMAKTMVNYGKETKTMVNYGKIIKTMVKTNR